MRKSRTQRNFFNRTASDRALSSSCGPAELHRNAGQPPRPGPLRGAAQRRRRTKPPGSEPGPAAARPPAPAAAGQAEQEAPPQGERCGASLPPAPTGRPGLAALPWGRREKDGERAALTGPAAAGPRVQPPEVLASYRGAGGALPPPGPEGTNGPPLGGSGGADSYLRAAREAAGPERAWRREGRGQGTQPVIWGLPRQPPSRGNPCHGDRNRVAAARPPPGGHRLLPRHRPLGLPAGSAPPPPESRHFQRQPAGRARKLINKPATNAAVVIPTPC